jgi:Transcriptional regulators of sugar metabolism
VPQDDRSRNDIQTRHLLLNQILSEEGPVGVKHLARRLGCSKVTVYRDVAQLEAAGVVRLSRGMVIPERSSLSDAPPELRAEINSVAKEEICREAMTLIAPGSTVILDDSSTVLPLAAMIGEKTPLTVITNSQPVVRKLRDRIGLQVYVVGGLYYPWAEACYGSTSVSMLQSIQADICFFSTSGITERGVANSYDYIAETKRAMLHASTTRVLLADSAKFGRRAMHTAAVLPELTTVITDVEPHSPDRVRLESAGIELIVCSSPDVPHPN